MTLLRRIATLAIVIPIILGLAILFIVWNAIDKANPAIGEFFIEKLRASNRKKRGAET